jgi:hypothetical protein
MDINGEMAVLIFEIVGFLIRLYDTSKCVVSLYAPLGISMVRPLRGSPGLSTRIVPPFSGISQEARSMVRPVESNDGWDGPGPSEEGGDPPCWEIHPPNKIKKRKNILIFSGVIDV